MLKRFLMILGVLLAFICITPNPSYANTQQEYTLWSDQPAKFNPNNNVRTITFSQPVSIWSLRNSVGEVPISLWDVTNPNMKKPIDIEVGISSKNPKQLKVLLSKGNTYEDGHSYSLFIEQDIKSDETDVNLDKPIQYNFIASSDITEVAKQDTINFYEGLVPRDKSYTSYSYFYGYNGYTGFTFDQLTYNGSKSTGSYKLEMMDESGSYTTYSETANNFTIESSGIFDGFTLNYPIKVGNISTGVGYDFTRDMENVNYTVKVVDINSTKIVSGTVYENVLVVEKTFEGGSTFIFYLAKDVGLISIGIDQYKFYDLTTLK